MTQSTETLAIKAAIADVDLRLIDALWDIQDRAGADMRPSDRHSIRQAFAAAERLGARLIALAGLEAHMACRVLPAITQTTRVRRTPERVWLQFSPRGAAAGHAVLFLELGPKTSSAGVYVPAFASASARKAAWERFRKRRPKVFRGLRKGRPVRALQGADDIGPRAWGVRLCRPPEDAPHGVPQERAPEIDNAMDNAMAPEMATEMAPAMVKDGSGFDQAVGLCVAVKTDALSVDRLHVCLAKAGEVFAAFLDAGTGRDDAPRPAKGKLTLVAATSGPNVAHRA